MKVKDLAELVNIWELASLDQGTKSVYVSPGSVIAAHFQGLHCEARRISNEVEIKDLETDVGLDGATLTGVLSLMDEEDALTAEVVKAGLILRATGQRTGLRKIGAEPRPPLEAPDDGQEVDIKELRKAVNFLQKCTAEGVISPILAGIRFTSTKKKNLLLVATDAERRTGRCVIKSALAIEGAPIVPALDLSIALNIMGDTVIFSFTETQLFLSDETTVVRISLLRGSRPFPDIERLPRKFEHTSAFPASRVDTAIKAATLLDADRLIAFVIKDGVATLGVSSQETGTFRMSVSKEKNVEDVILNFDAYWLDAAGSVGSEVELRYNSPKEPVLFVGRDTGYLLWMSPVVR